MLHDVSYGPSIHPSISREDQTFAEAVLDSLRKAEERRTKSEQVEEDGGAFPGNPRHPVGWVGT